MTELSGSSTSQKISQQYDCYLQAPDLLGEIREIEAVEVATRADAGLYEASLQQVFSQAGMTPEFTFELDITEDRAPGDTTTRADGLTATTREGDPAIILTVPELGANTDYAVLYTDEGGTSRWLFPAERLTTAEAARGSGGEVAFHLPRASAPVAPEVTTTEAVSRGPISKLGRRLVRVLTWATDEIVGKTALQVVTSWEEKRRPYQFLWVQPDLSGSKIEFSQPVDWEVMRQGRTLMLIHGTFSTAQASFGLIPLNSLAALVQHYDRRIIAFNHPSLHHSPTQNVQTFLEMLPPGLSLDLDLVTHSRGGLVGRELTEWLPQLNQQSYSINIHKVIFVAAPHQGTILANEDKAIDLLDRYTNFLTNLPDEPFSLTVEAILMIVKLIAHGTMKGLPGLHSMRPQGDYLSKRLNAGQAKPATQYYALGANFTPTDPALLARLAKKGVDIFIDNIFDEDNDGVVPTAGIYQAGHNSSGFPVPAEQRFIYEGEAQIHHCNFFQNSKVAQQIYLWLKGVAEMNPTA